MVCYTINEAINKPLNYYCLNIVPVAKIRRRHFRPSIVWFFRQYFCFHGFFFRFSFYL